VPTPERDLPYVLALRALPGLGDVAQVELLRTFGSAEAAWDAWPDGWPTGRGSAETRTRARARAEVAMARAAALGATVTDILQPDYPDAFRILHDPPAACFLLGDATLLRRPAVAIVGSRACTDLGAETARLLGAELARCGLVVLSGLARGIDGAAHEGALAVGGATVAVLGSGLDVAYPAEHTELQRRIAERGCLVTEFLPDEGPRRHHFPRRNRLLAALARGVVVVEAAADSGALITVDHALDLGRPVMAFPGPALHPAYDGSNRLLRDGAVLVFDAGDVWRGLADAGALEADAGALAADAATFPSRAGLAPSGAAAGDAAAAARGDRERDPEPPGLGPAERRAWRGLDRRPCHVDQICARTGLAPSEALTALAHLEFRGLARQLPGMRFVRG
jgi:DNA processing protein